MSGRLEYFKLKKGKKLKQSGQIFLKPVPGKTYSELDLEIAIRFVKATIDSRKMTVSSASFILR